MIKSRDLKVKLRKEYRIYTDVLNKLIKVTEWMFKIIDIVKTLSKLTKKNCKVHHKKKKTMKRKVD